MAEVQKEERAMPANKNDVIQTLKDAQVEVEKVVGALPDDTWAAGVYENGWNAKQLLCHIVESPGVAGFLIGMAKAPGGAGSGSGAGFDIDAWNAQRVAALETKPVAELLKDLRANTERNIAAVQAVPDDLLGVSVKAPWDAEGAVGDLIRQSVREHSGMHLADLRGAAG